MVLYVDTTYGFSFRLPNWFSVGKSAEYRDVLDVRESGEFSFKILILNLTELLELHADRTREIPKDSTDCFLYAAKEEAFRSLVVNYHGIVVYGRIDSLKEYKSLVGQRVLAIYRTAVSEDGSPVDFEQLGPLYIVDISQTTKGRLLAFDYSWFDFKQSTYRELATAIALSVELR